MMASAGAAVVEPLVEVTVEVMAITPSPGPV
jgi:hypothetical protein